MRIVRRPGTSGRKPVEVRDLMSRDVVSIAPDSTLRDVAGLMREHKIGSLLVVSRDQMVGIVTERDLMRAIADGHDPSDVPVARYMTLIVKTIEADRPAAEAAAIMVRHNVRHLPVTERGTPIGFLSARNVLALEPWPKELPVVEPW
jgi:MHS family proline/betaine transporter-like MFS transporter